MAGARYTNLFLMGMPRGLSGKYIEQYAPALAALGCEASAAPNSICVKNVTANKVLIR